MGSGMSESFLDWRLGTQARFDGIRPLGSAPDTMCRRSPALFDWSRAHDLTTMVNQIVQKSGGALKPTDITILR